MTRKQIAQLAQSPTHKALMLKVHTTRSVKAKRELVLYNAVTFLGASAPKDGAPERTPEGRSAQ